MQRMFFKAAAFDGDVSTWDVSQVTVMRYMFGEARDFNQDLSNWDVSNVQRMDGMFRKASEFNGDISRWDVGKVNDMTEMFNEAAAFAQNLSDWQVAKVHSMTEIFHGAKSFNSDISSWAVDGTERMKKMFAGATAFDQDLCQWGPLLKKMTRIENMFEFTSCAFEADPDYRKKAPGPFCHICYPVDPKDIEFEGATLVNQGTGRMSISVEQLPSNKLHDTETATFVLLSAVVALGALLVAGVTKFGRYASALHMQPNEEQSSARFDMELTPYQKLNGDSGETSDFV
jgi:surface protein